MEWESTNFLQSIFLFFLFNMNWSFKYYPSISFTQIKLLRMIWATISISSFWFFESLLNNIFLIMRNIIIFIQKKINFPNLHFNISQIFDFLSGKWKIFWVNLLLPKKEVFIWTISETFSMLSLSKRICSSHSHRSFTRL